MYLFKFGKHKGKTLNEVLEKEPSYYLWILSKFTRIDPELKTFILTNKEEIKERARQEHAEFLYDYCDGDAGIEY